MDEILALLGSADAWASLLTLTALETVLGTASISGNALYVRSDGHLWKIAGK